MPSLRMKVLFLMCLLLEAMPLSLILELGYLLRFVGRRRVLMVVWLVEYEYG